MKYICPKCKTKHTSEKPIEYCVCGGKLRPDMPPQAVKKMEDLINRAFSPDLSDKEAKTVKDIINGAFGLK